MRISEHSTGKQFITEGITHIHEQQITYKVISEETMLDGNNGKLAASMFSYSYFRTNINNIDSRPVLFIYNGGPGSSSHLMHVGFFAPDRIKPGADSILLPVPPFETEENPNCLLDAFDLVLIDPVDTGYGKLIDEETKDEFFGVEQDAMSFVIFIEHWLTKYDRWNSPRFICGESYGTTRSAVLVNSLMGGVSSQRFSCITVNGVIMLGSTYHMDSYYEELPVEDSVLKLMSYAAANWYHKNIGKQEVENNPALYSFVEDAYLFSMTEYAHALLMGDYLNSSQKREIIHKLHVYTGVPEKWFEEYGLRLTTRQFLQNFLKENGMEAGGYDSRVILPLSDMIGQRDSFDDPSMAYSNPAYASLFHSHFKKKLGITLTQNYISTNVKRCLTWNYQCSRTPCQCLASTMRRNRNMKVLFATGLYDLCTCAGYARYVISQMGLPLERVIRKEYEGGHMIYTNASAASALEKDIREFINSCK